MECSICISNIVPERDDIVDLDCGHSFHTNCINMWLNVNNSCPNCRNMVISNFKCRYSPYPFFPLFNRKGCIFKINDDSIVVHFTKAIHLKHNFKFVDIQKILLVGESIVIRHNVSEDHLGRRTFKNFSYDFVDLQSAMSIFNTLCNKLNQEYISYRNIIFN